MAGSKKSDAPPQTIEVGDIVLAKIKGYPAWPARVIDPETAPLAVKKDRPKGTKTTFYCVCFFPKGDHAWQVLSGIQKLQKHEIEAYINEPHRKSGELLDAYKIALDPSEWDSNRAETLRQLEEDAKEAPIDELDEDADDSKSGKKRKRDSDAGDKKKPAKKATARPKADPAPSKAKKRGRKNGNLSAATIAESEDEAGDKPDNERPFKKAKADEEEDDEECRSMLPPLSFSELISSESAMSEEAKLVKSWRHELQRMFLSKNGVIKAEDMDKASSYLKTVEDFGSKMTLPLLSSSKIGKVIKKMTALPSDAIPNGDEFKIRERSNALLLEWSKLASNTTNGEASAPPESAEPAVNGDAKMEIDPPTEGSAPEAAPATTDAAPTTDASADVEMKVDAPAPAPAADAAPAAESAPAPAATSEAPATTTETPVATAA